MSCYYPKLAIKTCLDSGRELIDGQYVRVRAPKYNIRFVNRVDWNLNYLRRKFGDDVLLLPCGHCLGCKFDKAKDWATRAVCEMQYHDKACFLTLTYDDEFLPKSQKENKNNVLDFIKALRNRGVELRYLGCGERGTTTNRIHAHLILFGYRPDDLILHSRGSQGDFLYESPSLASLWAKGFVMVGDCSYQSAGYVARYTTKKVVDDDSFLVCSTRPGIGKQYYDDHKADIVKSGFVYGDFGDNYKAPIPRYFEKFLLQDFPDEYCNLIKDRMRKVLDAQDNELINHCFTYPEQLKVYIAEILDRKLKAVQRR